MNAKLVRVVEFSAAVSDLNGQRGTGGLVYVPGKSVTSLRAKIFDYSASRLPTGNQADEDRWNTSSPRECNWETRLGRGRRVDSQVLGSGQSDQGSQSDEDGERHGLL